eukprot:TRINITY_DN6628_c0_g1_i1.p1 TRINITY_DN6628_c0_g1~~TRINITY_DN6628_c0_g1_i1.p1  ORF type:complete len:429 (-),score=69.11 TRINITY_DN6628_c0_g1_i1:93-1208(-)
MGSLFTVRGTGYLLGSIIGSKAYDQKRISTHVVLMISVFIIGLICFIIPFITSLWMILGSFLFIGFAAGLIDVGGNTLLMWAWKDKVSGYMQLLHFFFGIGAFGFPFYLALLQFFFSESMSVSIGYWSVTVMCLSGILLMFVKSPKPDNEDDIEKPDNLNSNDEDDVINMNNLIEGDHLDEEDGRKEIVNDYKSEISNNLKKVLYYFINLNTSQNWMIIVCSIILFFYVGAEVNYGAYIYYYAKDNGWADSQEADMLTSLFWMFLTLGRLIAAGISSKVSVTIMLFTNIVGSLISMIILGIATLSTDIRILIKILLYSMTCTLGLFMSSLYPSVVSIPANLNLKVTGQSTSIMVIFASFGMLYLTKLAGRL